jgi:Ca2+-binding RTX toxin-like protein
MKSRFITDPQDPSDGFLNTAWAEVYTNFLPAASRDSGNPPASAPVEIPSTPALTSEAVVSESAQSGSTSVIAMTSGGITINLLFDAAAMAAPSSFRAGIEQAASMLTATISDKITVNLKIDYSGTGGGAAAGPDNGVYESYSSVRADLINHATPGDTTFNTLPSGSSFQGQSDVAVWNAQLKLWGLLGANDTTTDDGSATFATDINSSLLVGVALHELTHAMGRVPYGPPYGSQPDIFDFFRFTSVGTRLIDGANTAPAAYFSVDGGYTKLADYGQNSDPSDFLNSGVQDPNDPFNEYYTSSTLQQLTAVDIKQLDALGFTIQSSTIMGGPGNDVLVAISGSHTYDGGGGINTISYQNSPAGVYVDLISLTADNGGGHDTLVNIQNVIGSRYDDTIVSGAANSVITGGLGADTLISGSGNDTFVYNNASEGGDTVVNFKTGHDVFQLGSGFAALTGVPHQLDGNIAFEFGLTAHSAAPTILFDSTSGKLQWDADGNGGGASVVLATLTFSTPALQKIELGNTDTYTVLGTGDFNNDGTSDVVWQNKTTGQMEIWYMANGHVVADDFYGNLSGYNMLATGNFNGTGASDIVWQSKSSGQAEIWYMSQGKVVADINYGNLSGYNLLGSGDINHDGTSDIIWQNKASGQMEIWSMGNNGGLIADVSYGNLSAYNLIGTTDLNHDGNTDLIWQNKTTGKVDVWFMGGGRVIADYDYGNMSGFKFLAAGDLNHDGNNDLLWQNTSTGAVFDWIISPDTGRFSGDSEVFGTPTANAKLAGAGDFYHNGGQELIWQDATIHQTEIWDPTHNSIVPHDFLLT